MPIASNHAWLAKPLKMYSGYRKRWIKDTLIPKNKFDSAILESDLETEDIEDLDFSSLTLTPEDFPEGTDSQTDWSGLGVASERLLNSELTPEELAQIEEASR